VPTIAGLTRMHVVGARGKRIGRVAEVLFAAEEPRVVGLIIDRPRVLWLFDRKDVYAAFEPLRREEGRLVADSADALGARAAKRYGLDWDRTVVWRGMPVVAEDGERVGTVGDAAFGSDGRVTRLLLSGGLAADVAVGTREISGDDVRGFDGSAVRVAAVAAVDEYTGGAAAVAGRTAAQASVAGERAAKRAAEVAVKAARSETGQAAAAAGKSALGWLKKAGDYVAEGWSDDDEE